MKVQSVAWGEVGLVMVIDGVEAVIEPRRDWCDYGFVTLGDTINGMAGYWADTIGPKTYRIGEASWDLLTACEDPVVVAEARLYCAVMAFGEDVPGVVPKYGPRPVMTVAEAKAALRAGLWGFQKLRIP